MNRYPIWHNADPTIGSFSRPNYNNWTIPLNKTKFTYSTAGVPPSFILSLIGFSLVGEPEGVCPFNTSLGTLVCPSLSFSRSLSFLCFLSFRLCSSLPSWLYIKLVLFFSFLIDNSHFYNITYYFLRIVM